MVIRLYYKKMQHFFFLNNNVVFKEGIQQGNLNYLSIKILFTVFIYINSLVKLNRTT